MSDSYPCIALQDRVLLPGMIVNIEVSRSRARKAAKVALLQDARVFMTVQKDPLLPNPGMNDLFPMGTVAKIVDSMDLPNEHIRLRVEGEERAQLVSVERDFPYMVARVEPSPMEPLQMSKEEQEGYFRAILEGFQRYRVMTKKIRMEVVEAVLRQQELKGLAWQVCLGLDVPWGKRQEILECDSEDEMVVLAHDLLVAEMKVAEVQAEILAKTQKSMEKNQRDYFLREQMKVIREELGEEGIDGDADRFEEQLSKLEIGQEEAEKIRREINRFRRMSTNSVDATVMRGYLETILELPWNHQTQDTLDMKRAWEILQADHYGLKDVKERVMEFLAVRGLTGGGRGPILCLVGPPGTGKTSVAKSIAKALDKKYVRVCLGGVKDEAQIRGHRRTYVGALPGEITSALRQCGCCNPLMLLDEIDKTGADYKGDVSSALLEVLDPEQNAHFHDHYVDIPQNLSQVLFIATANDMHSIPRPLLDRMEVVEIPGYTANEKWHIAVEHLIPKQQQENGLTPDQVSIDDGALRKVINLYTKEAGVRSLERTIGKICRRAARRVMEGETASVAVTEENLTDFLGKPKFSYLMANKKDEIGIARGLAWTQVGGDTLEIEVNVMPGKGEIIMTGQLGDVMKESAQAGITYIRSIADEYGVKETFFQEHDLHVHVPAGAVPKDGPSAGITMATAMLSAIACKPVRADVAMTGEITLRGRVLPIGGLKEKLLAAKYAQIKQVLVPEENRADVEEMEAEITQDLTITYVESMRQVLEQALS